MVHCRFLRFLFYSLLCLLAGSCSIMPNELDTAERLLETAPDSALHILQRITPDKYKSDSKRALYGLLMIRALDKNILPLKPDSLLDFSINYYLNHTGYDHLATCYLYKGRSYKNNFQYEKAIGCYLQALDVLENKDNNMLLGRVNSDLGDIYVLQKDYLQARQKFILSYKNFKLAKQQIYAYYSVIDIGKTYYFMKEYHTAQQYFHKVYSSAKDSLTLGAAIDEVGLCYYKSKQYDSARVYFQKVIHYPYIGNNKSIRYYYLANLYFDLNKVDSAYYYAKNAFTFNSDIHTQRECYRILTNCEYLKGDMKTMSVYMNEYVLAGDSLRKIDAQTKGSILETIHNTNLEVVKVKNNFWLMVGLITLVIMLGVFLFIKIKKRNKVVIRETEIEHTHQKADIRIETMHKYRKTLLQKIETVRLKQTVVRKKASPTEKDQLDRKLFEEILHLNDPEFFHRRMDAVLNDLVSKLKTRYPALTDKEICWCCLHLLNIPTTAIYLLLDYKVDSLKKMRQRLAQKTGLAGVTELDDFLNAILSE
jgi:tetratricopeptide (TPR) repeat protein